MPPRNCGEPPCTHRLHSSLLLDTHRAQVPQSSDYFYQDSPLSPTNQLIPHRAALQQLFIGRGSHLQLHQLYQSASSSVLIDFWDFSLSQSVHTSPWHRVIHRNFIFDIHMHIYSPYMHIKYLVILTCSF